MEGFMKENSYWPDFVQDKKFPRSSLFGTRGGEESNDLAPQTKHPKTFEKRNKRNYQTTK